MKQSVATRTIERSGARVTPAFSICPGIGEIRKKVEMSGGAT
jgi:hypothetical protein